MENRIRKILLCCAVLLAGVPFVRAQQPAPEELQIVFRFVGGDDMFYVPWNGNGAGLDSLCRRLDPATLKEGSVQVDGYGSDRELVKIRCNRVKSALVSRRGLAESHFATTLRDGLFNGLVDVVVVTCPAMGQNPAETFPVPPRTDGEQPGQQQPVAEKTPEPATGETAAADGQQATVQETTTEMPAQAGEAEEAKAVLPRWSAGLNVGIPFFWGDMLSLSADKPYVGFAVGVQGSYRMSGLLAVSLSVDYARGKLGARGYAGDYLLAADGQTWYVPQQQAMQRYGDLYSVVSLVNVGLGLDVNLNRIFSKQASGHRFTVWVSPTVYGQFFSAHVCTKAADRRYSDGTTQPDGLSWGLGGALTLRCRINRSVGLQLKNTLVWITDNHFDGIRTPFGKTRQNALWLPQVGVVWNFQP